MNTDQILQSLINSDLSEIDTFEVLKHISLLINQDEEDLAREVLFQVLERKQAFENYSEIIDTICRELGLFPYIEKPEELNLADSLAYDFHRGPFMPEALVFHREQAQCFRRLLKGENIILSAPTSFGKSKVIDAVIATRHFKNIVVIVPTLALIDETRKRLADFANDYRIITQVSQNPEARNIFVFTAERLISYQKLPEINFFVIDEFYKIGNAERDPKRTAALNQAFYLLYKQKAQFYLLGPAIKRLPQGLEEKFNCKFVVTPFSTVGAELYRIRVQPHEDEASRLATLLENLSGEPTLIYCSSPDRANFVVKYLAENAQIKNTQSASPFSRWLRDTFHPQWLLPSAIDKGIAFHHGRLPRSIAQYIVAAFNSGHINYLVCTSTLIEGVNTTAKNVIIFDNSINKRVIDFFTFNNIKGRSGRMFKHFIGRVFTFHDPPDNDLPFVDFPVFTQTDSTPSSLLVQMDETDLTEYSKQRLYPIFTQKVLSLDIIRKHASIEPDNLVSLANALLELNSQQKRMLNWGGYPRYKQLELVCNLIWDHLDGRKLKGVTSAKQLTFKLWQLQDSNNVKERIMNEIRSGFYANRSIEYIIESIFEFDRSTASYDFPQQLKAVSDIKQEVLGLDLSYGFYASKIESLFRDHYQMALEEFGIPIQVTDKFSKVFRGLNSLDEAIQKIKALDLKKLKLSEFEFNLVSDCIKYL